MRIYTTRRVADDEAPYRVVEQVTSASGKTFTKQYPERFRRLMDTVPYIQALSAPKTPASMETDEEEAARLRKEAAEADEQEYEDAAEEARGLRYDPR